MKVNACMFLGLTDFAYNAEFSPCFPYILHYSELNFPVLFPFYLNSSPNFQIKNLLLIGKQYKSVKPKQGRQKKSFMFHGPKFQVSSCTNTSADALHINEHRLVGLKISAYKCTALVYLLNNWLTLITKIIASSLKFIVQSPASIDIRRTCVICDYLILTFKSTTPQIKWVISA